MQCERKRAATKKGYKLVKKELKPEECDARDDWPRYSDDFPKKNVSKGKKPRLYNVE